MNRNRLIGNVRAALMVKTPAVKDYVVHVVSRSYAAETKAKCPYCNADGVLDPVVIEEGKAVDCVRCATCEHITVFQGRQ